LVTTASAIVVEPSSELSGPLPRSDFEEASAGSLAPPDLVAVRGDWLWLINCLLEVVPPIAGTFVVGSLDPIRATATAGCFARLPRGDDVV
jgi:hypothetical protein